MFNLTSSELQSYISEDIPYFDLTTSLQDSDNQKASIEIYTREDVMVACSEEAARIAEHFNCSIDILVPSGEQVAQGGTLLSYEGAYVDVHQAYRLTQILLEYSCKIATYAYNMNQSIKSINPNCELLTTRKTFPFAKKFCIKAAMCGGAMPHRLGLSETILFFDAHRILYGSDQQFYDYLKGLKAHIVEKKIVVESESFDDATQLMRHGVDVLQLDKLETATIEKIVGYKDENFADVKIIVAGGINVSNAQEYAKTNIDGVVTSAVYQAGMANLGARLKLI